MLPKHSIFHNTLLLTGIDLLLRAVGMTFQIYLSGKIGAAGLGLLQLVLTVGALAQTFANSGVRTATMYLCAEEYGKGRPAGMRHAVWLCILWGGVCSLAAGGALYALSGALAEGWIRDTRAASGLRILAISLPVSTLMGVLGGYFTARGHVWRLALAEILQQFVSSGLTVLLLHRAQEGTEAACRAILLGNLGASLAAVFCLLVWMRRELRKYGSAPEGTGLGRRLVKLCVPLALGEYLRSGLRTLEQLLIPLGLSRAGGSGETAMAAYGTIHAMVFPILMFPAALLFSLADLLVPELARCGAAGNRERIRRLCTRALRAGVAFAGAVAALELLLAEPLGRLLYKSNEAGAYLRLFAPMIVILYPDAIVDAMCKGLGKQAVCVRNNTLTSLLDVALLCLLLPRLGVEGYLLTFAVTHVLNFYLSVRLLMDTGSCEIAPDFLGKTALSILFAVLGCLLLPRGGAEMRQIVCCAGTFFALYLPTLHLLETFSPEERRWLRRTVAGRKGR